MLLSILEGQQKMPKTEKQDIILLVVGETFESRPREINRQK